MVNEKMTVHKALTELKTIDDRIDKLIEKGTFIASKKHSADKINGVAIDDWMKDQKSIFDQLTDLIARKNALRRGVTLSNATTKVEVCGTKYTVAEAISMKNDGMTAKENLLIRLSSRNGFVGVEIQRDNRDLEERADNYVISLYGKDNSKVQSGEVKKTRDDFIAAQTSELVDAIGFEKVAKQLEEEINTFMVEVDGALSVSNALTEIEISY